MVGLHGDFEDWLTRQAPIDDPEAYLFPTLTNHKAGGRRGLSAEFSRIMERAGVAGRVLRERKLKGRQIRSLSFHSFRHTAASSVFNSEALKEAARRVTNHARGGVIDRYVHADVEAIRAATDSIERLPKVDE